MPESLFMHRRYEASPERVFEAWTNVELLRQWFGCGPGMLWNVHEWDVRVGGAIRVSVEFDHGPFEVRGEFLVVDAPHHLRYRWSSDQIVDVRTRSARPAEFTREVAKEDQRAQTAHPLV